jgi:hypothetical protein
MRRCRTRSSSGPMPPSTQLALIWNAGDKSPTPTRCSRRGSTVITALRLQLPNNLQCVSFIRNLPCIRLHGEKKSPLHMSHPSPVSCRLINEGAHCLERYAMVPVDVGFCDVPLRPYEHHPGVSFITYCVIIEKRRDNCRREHQTRSLYRSCETRPESFTSGGQNQLLS